MRRKNDNLSILSLFNKPRYYRSEIRVKYFVEERVKLNIPDITKVGNKNGKMEKIKEKSRKVKDALEAKTITKNYLGQMWLYVTAQEIHTIRKGEINEGEKGWIVKGEHIESFPKKKKIKFVVKLNMEGEVTSFDKETIELEGEGKKGE